jgi:PAS domain S-box-containing protein
MRLTILVLIITLTWFSYSAQSQNQDQRNILVLHSYHSSFQWNKEIQEGIKSGLQQSADRFHIQHEYMDSKRIFNESYKKKLSELYKIKFPENSIDIIITTDDDALEFVIKQGDTIFPGIPVIFTGVNYIEKYTERLPHHITGVVENLEVPLTLTLALKLLPQTKNIYFVGDQSNTAIQLSEIFRKEQEKNFQGLNFQYLHDYNVQKLAQSLTNLPDNSIVMLWPFLTRDENLLIDNEIATQIICNASSAPVFGFWHFMLGHGIVGGKLVSGLAHGELAAKMAIDILNNKNISDIPVVDNLSNKFYFDYQLLQKHNINEKALPQNSIVINKPKSFLVENINILLFIFIVLIIFTTILIINTLINKKIKKVLVTELQFRHDFINALPTPVFLSIDNQTIKENNLAFEKLTGLTLNKLNNQDQWPFYPPYQVSEHKRINKEVLETQKPATYEGQIIAYNGKIRDVIFYKSYVYNAISKQSGVIETIVDITDKKQSLEKIKQSEERYSLATKATQDGIWDWNVKTNELFISQRLKEIIGYDINETLDTYTQLQQLLHPSDINLVNHQLELLEEGVKEAFSAEIRIQNKTGKYIWIELNAFAVSDEKNEIFRVVGSISDIQARKSTENDLKTWSEIFRNTQMGLATFDKNGFKPLLFNPVFAQMHGYTEKEMSELTILDIVAPEKHHEIDSIIQTAIKQGHHVLESVHKKKNEATFPVMVDITTVKNKQEEVEYYIVNIQDITERKKQENIIAQMLSNEQTMNEELRSSEEEVKQTLQQTVKLKELLEENQIQFLKFIDGTSDFAILKDRNFRYLIVNKAFASFHNLEPSKIIGKTDEEIVPLWLAKEENKIDKEITENNRPIIYERKVNNRIFETRKFPVYYDGNTIGIGAFIRDITQQRLAEKQVAENEKRFKTLLENSFDLITLTDEDGIINYCTDAITKVTGHNPKDVLGKHFSIFLHPDDRAEFSEKFTSITELGSKVEYLQHQIKNKDAEYRQIETIITNHLKNPLIGAIVFTSRDVSIEMQSRELKKNIILAQKSAEIKQRFLANMSHEIRTPMNGIVGMIEFLMRTDLNELQTDYITTIKSSADSLLSIINDILDYSKIEAGMLSINPSPVHVKKFITESPKIFGALVKQKHLNFEVFIDDSIPEFLNLDSVRLNQVITNLLSNAIKFTQKGEISLRVFPDKITLNEIALKIEVQDSGIGLSDEEQNKLFQPFTQIDSSFTRSIEGTGLGLTICRRIVELMGGEIGVISKPGKGSMFWFTITSTVPEIEKVKLLAKEDKIPENDQLNLDLLLVEDKAVNQKVIKIMLEAMGCTITIASNGKEAIELLEKRKLKKENPFDIILMDIQMPVMDGITATRMIRKDFPEHKVIIGLSANVFSSDVETFLKNGLDDYITKPAKSADFYKKLFHWSKKDKPNKILHDSGISDQRKNIEILDIPTIQAIKKSTQGDLIALNELFSNFKNDADELIRNIVRNEDPDGNVSALSIIQTLQQMSNSMGAKRVHKICQTLISDPDFKTVPITQINQLLSKEIHEYIAEARKILGLD